MIAIFISAALGVAAPVALDPNRLDLPPLAKVPKVTAHSPLKNVVFRFIWIDENAKSALDKLMSSGAEATGVNAQFDANYPVGFHMGDYRPSNGTANEQTCEFLQKTDDELLSSIADPAGRAQPTIEGQRPLDIHVRKGAKYVVRMVGDNLNFSSTFVPVSIKGKVSGRIYNLAYPTCPTVATGKAVMFSARNNPQGKNEGDSINYHVDFVVSGLNGTTTNLPVMLDPDVPNTGGGGNQ